MAAGVMGIEPNASRAGSRVSPVFRHVVCLTGLSPGGAVAEAHAALLAQASGACLTMYHASDIGIARAPRDPIPFDDMRTAAERLARATLERAAHSTGVDRARRQMVVERRAPTAATMAAAVRRLGADVVVMAPHDRGIL